MAVKRNFFPNAPGGSVNEPQRAQIAVGWPFFISQPVPVSYTSYIRSYLGDNDNPSAQGTAPSQAVSPSSSYLTYIRSFLGDN